ncbi:MFS transporter [Streptomyces sulfonofaciens]|uniref:MFS transporter n=1 Tax=Streptomyces sulfonofaciens TaxID=68272 RepID=UPI001E54523A|nr:MFS transporter [Streptomyces sulfonofaciens]
MALTGLRAAVTVFFALDGFVFAGWVVRIPAVKEQTDASASALGLALLGVSGGAVVTMMVTGRLCRRFGNHPMTVACGALLSLSVALPPLTHSAQALGGVLLLFGAAFGGLNVAMNSAAVDVVAALRRPVMPSFHAAFSLGGMLGSAVGGLLASHLSATRHLFALTVVGLLVTAAAGRTLLRRTAPVPTRIAPAAAQTTARTPGTDADPAAGTASGTAAAGTAPATEPVAGRPARRLDAGTRGLVIVFGLIGLCTAYGEGALADWGALHLQQDLATDAGVAATGYASFALAMSIGRITGTTLLERLGRTRTLVAGGATAAVGMLLGSLAPALWAALIGFGITGLGLANIFPVAIDRAGALAGPSGVAAASTLGYAGMLMGPPAIGFMADWFSLPIALTSVAALAALAALVGHATRHAAPA